uniref:Uncharacterized protein n=1 Tax=Aegilops tauschii subsp. strangulata TaxID=200361 RepID=A0A452ZCU5_AEGTS
PHPRHTREPPLGQRAHHTHRSEERGPALAPASLAGGKSQGLQSKLPDPDPTRRARPRPPSRIPAARAAAGGGIGLASAPVSPFAGREGIRYGLRGGLRWRTCWTPRSARTTTTGERHSHESLCYLISRVFGRITRLCVILKAGIE